MDSSPEKKPNNLPIPALVSLLFASLALLVEQFIPLESPRPKAASSGYYFYPNIQDVNARLWQDPFTTLPQQDSPLDNTEPCPLRLQQSHHDVKDLACSIIGAHNKFRDKPVTVLGVMVFGGPYAEDIEFRMRTRYAVLSGLAVKNYFPDDEQHIGYFTKPETLKFLPEKIPFEWFNAKDKDGSPVLLLWLDEIPFFYEPLNRARELVELLEGKTTNAASNDNAVPLKLNVKFIGPAGSTTLQAMIDELDATSSEKVANSSQQVKGIQNGDNENELNLIEYLKRQPFEFYNASASGEWPGLTFPSGNNDTNLQSYLKKQGLASLLIRTGLTDYQLASAMVEELKLRGFNINPECEKKQDFESCRNNKYHIALISEWDTLYGRNLPKAMKKALAPWLDECIKQKKSENECSSKWIHSFSYMRGLDGVIPGEEKTAEVDKSNKENGKNTKPEMERPERQSQKDYLRRLSMHISEIERDQKNEGEDIRAIGVLGSDAYDKLMILQALKPIFPNAVFFTTDLDTRLNYSEDFEVTRNLIASASFGLQLGSDFQQAIPPFRDSYQTAFFLAAQIAIDNANGKKVSQDEITEKLGSPRLFENGFSKAIPLGAANCSPAQNCKSYHPTQKYSAWPNWKLVSAGSFTLVLLIMFANNLSKRCRKFLGKAKRFIRYCIVFDLSVFWPNPVRARMRRRIWTLARMLLFPQVLILIVLGVTVYEISLGDQGEPFYWNEGVSIWPTELIRLFAGILGCLFIAKIAKAVEHNKRQLSKRFFCYDYLSEDAKEKRIKEHDGLRKKCGKSWVFVSVLWRWYCTKTSPQLRNRRVFWTFGISVLMGTSLLFIFGFPNNPYRGVASLLANYLVLLFCVPVFLVLVMMVVDATWRSVDLITRLGSSISIWPKETLRQFSLRQDLSRQGAIDDNALDKLRNELRTQGKYHLDEWIDIEFIAAHTKALGKLVYYPFIILALMIFARSKIFDNWDMPIGLVLIFFLSGFLTLACALYLRRAAEHSRQVVYGQINDMLVELSTRPEKAARMLEKQARIALNEIQKINEGAFLPISQEPAVQALLLPFGGWGGITLLEYFVLKGF
jgi:hypothetical protein